MSTANVVVEIDGFSDNLEKVDLAAIKASGALGVLIKVSQGTRWINPVGNALIDKALAAGLLVGALHYVEPEYNEPETEVSWRLSKALAVPLALGLVLEIDPPNGADLYALSTGLEQAAKMLALAGYEPGLRCSAATLSTLSGAPGSSRWWAGDLSDMVSARPFALCRDHGWGHAGVGTFTAYDLTSTRMLNPITSVPSPAGVDPHVAVGDLDVPSETLVHPAGPTDQDEVSGGVEGIEPLHEPEPTPEDEESDPDEVDPATDQWKAAARKKLAKV